MPPAKKPTPTSMPQLPPAKTPEGREHQMIVLAEDLVERQIRDGTVAAPILMHYIKMGSPREAKERAKLDGELAFQKAKIEQMESGARLEELYGSAIDAIRNYQGVDLHDEDEDDD